MESKADWLRSEIEKLEGKVAMVKLQKEKSLKTENTHTIVFFDGYIEALTSIITRYTEELKVLENVEQYKCKSYFDENNILQDCTCKRCT